MKGYTKAQKIDMIKTECGKIYSDNPTMELDEQEELCYMIKLFIQELPNAEEGDKND